MMPQAFEQTITVLPSDIDQQGHVNNVTYVRWVQEIATAHWRAQAPEEDQRRLLWVVLRHEIDYKQPAFAGEVILARTWVGPASRLKFERHTEFKREGVLLAKARTLWCPINAATGKPADVSADVRARFSSTAS